MQRTSQGSKMHKKHAVQMAFQNQRIIMVFIILFSVTLLLGNILTKDDECKSNETLFSATVIIYYVCSYFFDFIFLMPSYI